MRRFEVKYRTFFPASGMVCSLFILAVGFMLGKQIQMITGGILLLVTVLQIVVPVVVIESGEIQLRNLFGMTLKRFSFEPADITFSGLTVFVSGKKAIGSSWAFDPRPLQEFKEAILAAQHKSGQTA